MIDHVSAMIGPGNGDALGTPVGDGVGVGVAVGVAVGVGVGDGRCVGLAVGVGEGLGVAVEVGVGVGDGFAVGLADGEAVGAGERPSCGMSMTELAPLPPPPHAASMSASVDNNADAAMRTVPHRIAINLPSARTQLPDIGVRHTSGGASNDCAASYTFGLDHPHDRSHQPPSLG